MLPVGVVIMGAAIGGGVGWLVGSLSTAMEPDDRVRRDRTVRLSLVGLVAGAVLAPLLSIVVGWIAFSPGDFPSPS